jgi:hypothetical protein
MFSLFVLRHFAGGGEGVTVLMNEPFANHPELGAGQANEPPISRCIISLSLSNASPLPPFPFTLSFTFHSTQKRFIT